MATRNDDDDDGDEGAAPQVNGVAAPTNDEVPEGVRMLEGGAVEVEIEERDTRHSADAHEDVDTHDASGRELSPDEREALRAARRDEKKRRRQAGREREDRLRATLEAQNRVISEMTQRLAAVEQRGTVGEMQQIDRSIGEANEASRYFQSMMAAAIKANDGAAAADASAKMALAQRRAEELSNVRNAYMQTKSAPAPLDPRHQALANQWMSKHTWYNPSNTNDPDVRVALALDDSLFKEGGWDPTTPAYWNELTKRMTKYLPHRFANRPAVEDQDEEDDAPAPAPKPRQAPPRTPSVGGGSSDNSGAKGTYRLSAERVKALQEAGMWNDPAKRAKMVKRYVEQDRAQAQARR